MLLCGTGVVTSSLGQGLLTATTALFKGIYLWFRVGHLGFEAQLPTI